MPDIDPKETPDRIVPDNIVERFLEQLDPPKRLFHVAMDCENCEKRFIVTMKTHENPEIEYCPFCSSDTTSILETIQDPPA